MYTFCLHACMYTACMFGARRGRQLSWNRSCRWLWLPCGCWELEPGPLQEQQAFSTAEPSLHSWNGYLFRDGEDQAKGLSSKGLHLKGLSEILPQTCFAEFTLSRTNCYSLGLTGLLAGRVSAESPSGRGCHVARGAHEEAAVKGFLWQTC